MKRMITLLTVAAAVNAQAQWTMDDCIRYAVSHAASVQRQTVEVAKARTDVGLALSSFVPTVSASVSSQYSWGRNVDPETNTYNTTTTFNNYYSVGTSLRVFDGGQSINRLRQARLLRRQGLTKLQQVQDDKAIEVMQKYVDAVYAQQCVALATERLAESRSLLTKTQRMEQLGMKGMPDVAQVEAQAAEDDYNLTHQQNQLQTAMLALKSAMNYSLSEELRVKSEEFATAVPAGEGMAAANSSLFTLHSSLPAALAAEQGVRSAQLNHQIAKGRLLPSLSLQAGLSTSYFRSLTGGVAAPPFHSQFTGNMGEYVMATLSLPVFDLSNHKEIRKARQNVELAVIERDETLRQLADDARQAALDCEGYAKETLKMERKVQSDSVAYHLSRRKYEEGMLSTFDLHTAANTLLESRIRLLQTRLLYVIKQRLVTYYQEGKLWTE